jgi:hypothetical protein
MIKATKLVGSGGLGPPWFKTDEGNMTFAHELD